MEATAEALDTSKAIEVVDTLGMATDDLDAVQSTISEVQAETSGPHADRLHTAVQALQRVIDDLEGGEDTAEQLLDALR